MCYWDVQLLIYICFCLRIDMFLCLCICVVYFYICLRICFYVFIYLSTYISVFVCLSVFSVHLSIPIVFTFQFFKFNSIFFVAQISIQWRLRDFFKEQWRCNNVGSSIVACNCFVGLWRSPCAGAALLSVFWGVSLKIVVVGLRRKRFVWWFGEECLKNISKNHMILNLPKSIHVHHVPYCWMTVFFKAY